MINFPKSIDTFVEKSDPTISQIYQKDIDRKIDRINELQQKDSLSSSEVSELIRLQGDLSQYTFSASDYNKITDCIVSIEKSIKQAKFSTSDLYVIPYSINQDTKSFEIDFSGQGIEYDKNIDKLIVFCEGTLLVEDEDYVISTGTNGNGRYSVVRSDDGMFYATASEPLDFIFLVHRTINLPLIDYEKDNINYVYNVDSTDELANTNPVINDMAKVDDGEES